MPTDHPHGLRADLLARFEAVLPGHRNVAEDLLDRYDEPHRHYHDQRHLAAVLDRIDELAGPEPDMFVVRLAAWFHDAVYDLPERELTNEEASARLAIRTLGRVGLEQEDLNEIVRLVRLTESHHPGPRDPNGDLICDADLAVLAADQETYAAYVTGVRAEYARVSDDDFDRGRLDVLLRLRTGRLFRTGKGNRLLKPARANLDAEIMERAERLGLDPAELMGDDESQGV